MNIKEVIDKEPIGQEIEIKGWVRTFRSNRFIALNDGSTVKNLQVVVDFENESEDTLRRITTGACLKIEGVVIESQGKGQTIELNSKMIEILGDSDPEEYPLQPKKHSMEFLREIAHLRPRTQTFGAIFRLRHALQFAVHKYFNDNGFFMVHTPIVTGSDAEGAGEMFRVSMLDPANPPKNEDGSINWKEDFFGKETNLTVSGQLEAELFALGLGKVYTFGPTFRAENSNTTRHLAEFWMIEPEVAFNDLFDNMDLAEDCLKYVIRYVIEHCGDDLNFLHERQIQEEKGLPEDKRSMPLLEKLKFVSENEFVRCSYTEAIDILRNSKPNKKKKKTAPS